MANWLMANRIWQIGICQTGIWQNDIISVLSLWLHNLPDKLKQPLKNIKYAKRCGKQTFLLLKNKKTFDFDKKCNFCVFYFASEEVEGQIKKLH